ncbi:hypothetical protein HYQ45_010669 [Verticillium longisporum]|uniref:Uncharacterized protein n=1 Tax=Verticillium longisporum TaxID=100787 RepID=A0A8I2ZG02_VERLO|nr:hypothetical protein HYQ45_010669 [Verticillium longisporum]
MTPILTDKRSQPWIADLGQGSRRPLSSPSITAASSWDLCSGSHALGCQRQLSKGRALFVASGWNPGTYVLGFCD